MKPNVQVLVSEYPRTLELGCSMPYSTRIRSKGGRESAVNNNFQLTETVSGMSKVITPHFEKLIDRFVASGRFNNKSEVIRAGLRLLEEHEANAATASRDDLSRIIETALRDPRPLIPAADLLRRRQRR
jgi:antitoxin ParD1/3/4